MIAHVASDEREGRPKMHLERPPDVIADVIGLTRRESRPKKKGGRSCADCFFHRHLLCALVLDQPCSTFRADGPDGLVPPRQPSLLVRQGA